MDHFSNILLLSLFLPAIGAAVIAGGAAGPAVRGFALITTIATFVLSGWVVYHAAQVEGEFAVTHWNWLGANAPAEVSFSIGLDGLGLWMYGLAALLTITAVLVSWNAVAERRTAFYALLLTLETGMLGVFVARDLLLFYVFFEFTLIPLFFLIGIWGSEDRRYAAVKFFLYTLAGSLLTFVALLATALAAGDVPDPPSVAAKAEMNEAPNVDGDAAVAPKLTFSIPKITARLAERPLSATAQFWIFWGLFAGFAIKVPLFPLHTWLPLAHVQAPTAGSVILAGILLKIGTYGFVRFSLPWLPHATVECMPWILGLSVAGIIYGALVALAQGDIKRLIAYSSVSHLGFVMLGIFALNPTALTGGLMQMVNHGLSTGGLFAVVGMIYERYHTRQIDHFGGLARRLPWLTCAMLIFTFSSIGLPGMNGFVGEFLVLTGMFQRAWSGPASMEPFLMWIAVLSVTGVVLGAWYMLYLVQRVFYGPLHEPATDHGHDGHDAHASHGHAAHDHATKTKEADHGHGKKKKDKKDKHGHAAHGHDTHGHGHDDHGHGHAEPPLPPGPADMNWREFAALAPLVVFVFWIGLVPAHFLKPFNDTWKLAEPAAAILEKLDDAKSVAADAGVDSQTAALKTEMTTPLTDAR